MSIVYQITNIVTNQKYVGWTKKTSEERFKVHKQCAKRGDKSYLYNSLRKYGEDNFIIEELERGDDDVYMLTEREPYHISKLTKEERLNITDGGIGGKTSTSFRKGCIPVNKGKKMPTVSKAKKEYWEQWRKENPNYKDKWKKPQRISEERRKELSQIYSNKMSNQNKVELECPHCKMKGKGIANMKRWHFDNCKHAK